MSRKKLPPEAATDPRDIAFIEGLRALSPEVRAKFSQLCWPLLGG